MEPKASPRYIHCTKESFVTVLGSLRQKGIKWTALAATVSLVPALALAAAPDKRPAPLSFSLDSIGSFTPAGADPKLAAKLGVGATSISGFKFTPSAANGRPSQVRVAVRAGAGRAADEALARFSPSAPAITPSSYNLGVAVGWKRFALSGNVASAASGNPDLGRRESAVAAVSYDLKKFTGRVAVGAERDTSRFSALNRGDSYSIDVGGAYRLGRRVAVTGGVRYGVEKERIATLTDDRADSKAVYVGTALKF